MRPRAGDSAASEQPPLAMINLHFRTRRHAAGPRPSGTPTRRSWGVRPSTRLPSPRSQQAPHNPPSAPPRLLPAEAWLLCSLLGNASLWGPSDCRMDPQASGAVHESWAPGSGFARARLRAVTAVRFSVRGPAARPAGLRGGWEGLALVLSSVNPTGWGATGRVLLPSWLAQGGPSFVGASRLEQGGGGARGEGRGEGARGRA